MLLLPYHVFSSQRWCQLELQASKLHVKLEGVQFFTRREVKGCAIFWMALETLCKHSRA